MTERSSPIASTKSVGSQTGYCTKEEYVVRRLASAGRSVFLLVEADTGASEVEEVLRSFFRLGGADIFLCEVNAKFAWSVELVLDLHGLYSLLVVR